MTENPFPLMTGWSDLAAAFAEDERRAKELQGDIRREDRFVERELRRAGLLRDVPASAQPKIAQVARLLLSIAEQKQQEWQESTEGLPLYLPIGRKASPAKLRRIARRALKRSKAAAPRASA